jgi:hypothetical protein
MSPEICPHCGAAVPRRARTCPECGSDDTTGWSEDASAGDLGLPDEEFEYDRFVSEEFGKPGVKPGGLSRFWWVVAVGVVVAFLVLVLGGFG